MACPKFTVIRDTREQEQGDRWDFQARGPCAGTLERTLATGDYTLEGLEDEFVIERKSGTGELAKNITEDRFVRELERLESFKHPFIVVAATWDDVYRFPEGSGIPKHVWPRLRVSGHFMAMRLQEYELRYRARIHLAGASARDLAAGLFKRVWEARHG